MTTFERQQRLTDIIRQRSLGVIGGRGRLIRLPGSGRPDDQGTVEPHRLLAAAVAAASVEVCPGRVRRPRR